MWRGRRGRDRTTTYAICAYHNLCCEFESRSWQGVQHYVIKVVSDLRQVGDFLRVLRFPHQLDLKNDNSLQLCILDYYQLKIHLPLRHIMD